MKTLITGGAGYIGSTIANACLDNGIETVILDNLSTGRREFVGSGAFFQGDVRDQALLTRIFAEHRDIDGVIHCAARAVVPDSVARPLDYYDNNVVSLIRLLRSMQSVGCHRLLFSSSAAIYGPGSGYLVREHSPPAPANPYARTKHICELILRDVTAMSPLRVLSLRYFNPVGADPELRTGPQSAKPTHALGKMIEAHRRREAFTLAGVDWPTRDGSGIRDYVHVWDLARAHVIALQRFDALFSGGLTSRVINLGTGTGTTVRELLAAFAEVAGETIAVVEGTPRPGDGAGCYASSDTARKELGWWPERSIKSAIRDSRAWADVREKVLRDSAE